MIGKLTGKIDSIGTDSLIIDVGGVGYVVFASSRTLQQVEGLSGQVGLLIETHVREDHIHLYGFMSVLERDWFRLLTTVQGVGAKMALSILATLAPEDLSIVIAAQDITPLTKANGVGKKLAERVVNELKNKVGSLAVSSATISIDSARSSKPSAAVPQEEAVSALVNLGYNRVDAFQAVARAMQETGSEELDIIITHSLRELAA